MLTHITINNFTLVEYLDLNLISGMTAITGETGTGKSIVLEALAMALGERADADRVRHGAKRADITATFSLDDLPQAREWLIDNDLCHADECLLRRVITAEGRSRSFINAQPVTLQQVRALGELLIDIHSQHAHQSLLQKAAHLRLLDAYAQHQPLAKEVAASYKQWREKQEQLKHLRDNADEVQARYQLLHYQVEELNQLNLQEGELPILEEEQKKLSQAELILTNCQQVAELCHSEDQNEGTSLLEALQQTLRIIDKTTPKGKHLQTSESLLQQAKVLIEEAYHEVRQEIDLTELNPEKLHEVNERLSACFETARKHHVQAEELPSLQQELQEELDSLHGCDEKLDELQHEVDALEQKFMTQANKLSQQRKAAAKTLEDSVNDLLSQLSMQHADFKISVETCLPQQHGVDDIEFVISTNPGQPHKPLSKVASGGELSRISLAIQVATAATSDVATLVFDEVDVGIGGATADIVGQLLAQLGEKSQILCVTHLAQVASQAHQHWRVHKEYSEGKTYSNIKTLTLDEKVEEIARMISGTDISSQSLAHAQTMVEGANLH